MRKISMIAALNDDNIIGINGTLPWHLKKDFAWFVKQTTGKIVVMGRKNYEDIIRFTKGKPLKDRTNIVLTTKKLDAEGFVVMHSIQEVLNAYPEQDLMIIGGTQIYEQFLPYANELILTKVHKYISLNALNISSVSYFPKYDESEYVETYKQTETEDDISYDFCIYHKKNN